VAADAGSSLLIRPLGRERSLLSIEAFDLPFEHSSVPELLNGITNTSTTITPRPRPVGTTCLRSLTGSDTVAASTTNNLLSKLITINTPQAEIAEAL
jgi:hypothetical protein